MKTSTGLALFAVMLPLGSVLAAPATSAKDGRPEKPNIIILLTDDLGWQDVKCYDVDEESPMETPSMDALAEKGVKFWQGYSPCPTCAPTRSAILSGIHGARAQKTHVVGGAPPAPHGNQWRVMSPWYSGRMPVETYSIASALRDVGYETGHCGKWHIAISHHAYPQPKDHGFNWTQSNLGVTRKMTPHRLTGFSTQKKDDPYKLDENGYSTHQNSLDALEFVSMHKENPFFLYYCTWLVHTPIHTRNEALLDKYCKKLGVEKPIGKPEGWDIPGQKNPFYCAMVEELDYYVGQLSKYLEETDDPRWPGHKLVENTYVIFTSDNGGMEKTPGEIITDNYPLDKGKISIMEGGTRVPLIITGPDIPQGVESQVMINGLDFYPTLLSWAGAKAKEGQAQDGIDLSEFLSKDPTDPALVKEADGKPRDTMVWHFPNSAALESSIRIGDYKLLENYDHVGNKKNEQYELYRLYDSAKGLGARVDIEEAKNLAKTMPEKVKEMAALLHESLTEMKASYPYYNPYCPAKLPNKEKVPTALKTTQQGNVVSLSYRENGAKVVRADLIYTLNAGHKYEEWFREEAQLDTEGKTASIKLPEGTSHYFFNLIDENNYLISYPKIDDVRTRGDKKPSEYARTVRASGTPRPNIVHIMIDDLGWQDIAAHKLDGKPVYETPHMDRMTSVGRRFTQAYSPAPTCAPSRVSFLRGQYPTNTGVYHVMGGSLPRPWRPETNMISPYYAYGLPDSEPTIADVLGKAGYFTGHIAKWHAGGKSAGYPFPLDQGFHFGFTEKDGRHKYYNDEDLWNPKEQKKNTFFGSWSSMKPDRLTGFATAAEDDRYQLDENGRPFDKPQDMALGFIKKHSDKPFFLNYAPYFVHGPIQTRDRARFEKYLKKMGLEFPADPDFLRDRSGGKNYGHTNPYYASMVDTVDYFVGQIITLLEETDDPRNPGHKLIENTYVILDSDNGGVLPYTDNSPLQGGKQNTYEGGVRIPFLVLGPGVPVGTQCHTPISLVDLFPTFMQIAGAKEDPSLELDGCNIHAHLHGAQKATIQSDGSERKAIFWHFPMDSQMSVAMRKGPWKLVRNYGVKGGGNHKPTLELYQIYDEAGAPKDLSEETDVSAQYPEVHQSMKAEMLAYLKDHKAPEPYRNPSGADVTEAESVAIAKVNGLQSNEDKVSVSFETGEGKHKITEALFFYTLNPKPFDSTGGRREEWFQMEVEVGDGKADATMPPGATHGAFVLRDEKNFWIPSEPLVSVKEKDHKHNSSLLENGYAWKPGLHALVKLGKQSGVNTDAAEAVLNKAGATEADYVTAIRTLRKELRKVSQHPALNRFPTDPLF